MRENTKQGWEEKLLDLWKTKDNGLLGGVGEVLAWKYLWWKGFVIWPFWNVVHGYLFSRELTKKQLDYLEGYRSMASAAEKRTFDLVGILRSNRQAYLVEVKTTRSERYRYDSRKFPGLQQRLEAKSLGFKLLLVVARLIDNWRFSIACKEL